MLDLLVIHPGAAHGIYGSELADSLVAVEPPVWSRIIAAYIRDRGFSVQILDAEALRIGPKEVADTVRTVRPRLVCLAVYGHQPSASTQQMVGASTIAVAIKRQVEFGPPIIMVGGHVSALPERTLMEESVDFTCRGEGPITILGLLNNERVEDIPGLVYHPGPDADPAYIWFANDSAPLIDMKHLHGNVWDLLPMHLYRAHNWQCLDGSPRQPYASIHTTINCPFSCSFCCISAPFGNNVYRMRDSTEVVNEIVMLHERYGVSTFKIIDEMFILNERHYTAIAKQLIATGLGPKLNIWAYARVDTVKPDTLDMLQQAGFRWLALGIESGSKHVRDGAQKALKNDDIRSVVRAIQQAGINVIGNYIFGLPDDDYTSMQTTLNLALELNTEFANFYSAMAYPGSKLYTEAVEKGWTLPATWRGYSQHNDDCRPLDTQFVKAKDVLAFRDAAFQMYFTNPLYLAMIRHRYGSTVEEHIKQMTTFKLKRKLLEPELV